MGLVTLVSVLSVALPVISWLLSLAPVSRSDCDRRLKILEAMANCQWSSDEVSSKERNTQRAYHPLFGEAVSVRRLSVMLPNCLDNARFSDLLVFRDQGSLVSQGFAHDHPIVHFRDRGYP